MNKQLSKLVVGMLALLAFTGEANALAQSYSFTFQTDPNSWVTTSGGGTFSSYNRKSTSSYTDSYLLITGSTNENLSPLFTFPSTITPCFLCETFTNGGGYGLPTVTDVLYKGSTPVSFNNLSANTKYTFDVTAKGNTTAVFGYNLAINVTAVPEPAESALLMSGLGLVGFMVYRRKTNFAGVAAA